MDSVTPTIPEFFSGKNIFLTGATGFLGKSIMEKLFRCCHDIGNIYIVMRNKRGKGLSERLKILAEDNVFERLKKEKPSFKLEEKIIPLAGNMMELNLGLNDEDRQLIIDKVNIIIHCAASVRFNDSLTDAVITNVRGTREVCQIALDCKHLIVFMHVSTAFSNCDHFEIKEEMYPSKANWKNLIHIAENFNSDTLNALTPVLTNHMPNTYVFTKQVAENVVKDMMLGKIPTNICRPSVVYSAWKEPMPGWIDNFNGPVALVVGYGKGVMRTNCMPNDVFVDYIPVDLVTIPLIVSIWDMAIRQNISEIEVMHCANNRKAEWLNLKVSLLSKHLGDVTYNELPLNSIFWPPTRHWAENIYQFYVEIVICMLLPSIFLDLLLKLVGRKPMLKKLVVKMYNTTIALVHFTMNNFNLHNDKLFDLLKTIKPEDKEDWNYEFLDNDMRTYMHNCVLGGRRYLFNETDDTIPQARKHFQRMVLIEKIVWFIIFVILGNFLFNYLFKYIAL